MRVALCQLGGCLYKFRVARQELKQQGGRLVAVVTGHST